MRHAQQRRCVMTRLHFHRLVFAAVLFGALLVACNGGGVPETAGNRVIAFGLELDRGGDLAAAYGQLCSDVRRNVSKQSFQQSRGVAVSPMLASDSWILTRNEKVPSFQTEDPSVTETWTEMKVRWPPEGTAATSTTSAITWRVHLVREDGVWKVCRFEPAPDQSGQ
jgi:hypothetical protein